MSEDLERKPDGVPHDVVGLVVLFMCLAALGAGFFLVAIGKAIAVGIGVVATVAIVVGLRRRAARERDHVHPSL